MTKTLLLCENRGQTGNAMILRQVYAEASKCNNTKILYIPEMQGFSLHIIKCYFVINWQVNVLLNLLEFIVK